MFTVLFTARFVLRQILQLFRLKLYSSCALVPIEAERVPAGRNAVFGANEVNVFGETGRQEREVAPSVDVPLLQDQFADQQSSTDLSSVSEAFVGSEATLDGRSHNLRRNVANNHLNLLRRQKEVTVGHQGKLEDDVKLQTLMEDCILREGCRRLETMIAAFQRHECEVVRLESTMKKLQKDKERLKNSLIRAEMNISSLQVKMEALKKNILDQMLQHEKEKNDLKKMLTLCHSYCSGTQWLQQTKKSLSESCDQSYLLLDRNAEEGSMKETNMKTILHNTLNSSWTDQYQDSGLSLCTDAVDNSSSECDYEAHQDIFKCVHQLSSADGIQRLDTGMSDWNSDSTCSLAPSKHVSASSASTRKLLSAFSCQTDADILNAEESAPTYRLVLAGDAGAGKSSFLLRLSMNEFRDDIRTTLGVDRYIKKMLVDGQKTHLQIWDTAGQERFHSISQSYFRKAHGVFLLYDVTSQSSFLNIREWMDQIKEFTDEHISMCVIGNKVDLRAELPEGSCVSSTCGEKLAMMYNALFCETSAKDGTNVVEAVLHLAREIKKSTSLRQQLEPQMKLSLNSAKMPGSSCCGL